MRASGLTMVLHLVAIMACGVAGCGGGSEATFVPEPDALVGSYDVSFVDEGGRETASVGKVTLDEDGLLDILVFLPAGGVAGATTLLRGLVSADGGLHVTGSGSVTDIFFQADGDLMVSQTGSVQRIDGMIVALDEFSIAMRRSIGGVRGDLSGLYEFSFPFSPGGSGTPTSARILLDVPSDGDCQGADADELDASGEIIAQFDPRMCLVSTSGHVRLSIGYIDGTGLACHGGGQPFPPNPNFPCPLTLDGSLTVRRGAVDGVGRFEMVENGGFGLSLRRGDWHAQTVGALE